MSRLDIRLLGPPEIIVGRAPLRVDTRKAVALLAYLAVTGQRHRRDSLASLLWPQSDGTRARAALRRTLSSLSSALGGQFLDISREMIGLDASGPVLLDVNQFRANVARGRDGGQPAREELTAAVDLYRDDFMSGFGLRDSPTFDDWQYLEGEGLKRELAWALQRLSDLEADTGNPASAIEHARRWLSIDPLNEPAHRQLIWLYASAGDRAAAVRQYRDCVQLLDRELGVGPLEVTTDLYLAIMNGEIVPTPKSRERVVPEPSTRTDLTKMPFVGRHHERMTLIDAYDSVADGGRLIVVEGEAGIGKTRLSEELVDYVRSAGAPIVATSCFEGEAGIAYGVVASLLRSSLAPTGVVGELPSLPRHVESELSRLVPEFASPGADPPPLETPGSLDRFFDATVQYLTGLSGDSSPLLVFVDDFQWVDDASASLLSYIIRRLHRSPVCLLVAWRGEDAPAAHEFRTVVARSLRDGIATAIELGPLLPGDMASLVRDTSISLTPDQSRSLYCESEGIPFFAVEYLAHIEDSLRARESEWPIPTGIRDLIRSRLATVGRTGMQLLTTGAVIGRSFDFDLLRQTSGRSETETVDELERLVSRGLLQESSEDLTGRPTYDFSHDKVRTLVYDETSLARRRLIHRRVAEELKRRARRPAEAGRVAPQLGYHLRAAGMDREAADYYRQAGDYARSLYANAEALGHYEVAIALGHPGQAGLHESIGDLQTLLGRYAEALDSYQAAGALGDPECLPTIEWKMGTVRQRLGDWKIAESCYEIAFSSYPAEQIAERARVLADWSLTAHLRGDTDRAIGIGYRALELARESGDSATLAQTFNVLAILARSNGQIADAARYLEQSLKLADEMSNLEAKVAGLNNLSLVCADQRLYARAIGLTREALDLCRSQGDRHREAALLNNLADFFHATGDESRSMSYLKEAVGIFAEIGLNSDSVRPEIWKLVEW